jgi:hypothetical protein
MLGWFYIGYIAYFNYSSYPDGFSIGINLFLYFIFGFIPYLIITFLVYDFSQLDATKAFYLMMVRLILASMVFVVIMGLILGHLF